MRHSVLKKEKNNSAITITSLLEHTVLRIGNFKPR